MEKLNKIKENDNGNVKLLKIENLKTILRMEDPIEKNK